MRSRLPVYCIAVPGETSWARSSHGEHHMASRAAAVPDAASNPNLKRVAEEDVSIEDDAMDVDSSSGNLKKARGDDFEKPAPAAAAPSSAHNPFHPLGDATVPTCLVKIYGDEADDLRITDVYEFFGFYSFGQTQYPPASSPEEIAQADWDVLGSVADSVPRLHVIDFHKLENNNNPLLRPVAPMDDALFVQSTLNSFADAKQQLLALFADLLGGDTLAAEYLLLHLVSRVHSRNDTMALGKFSLNLVHVPSPHDAPEQAGGHVNPFVSNLFDAITFLTPKATLLPLALDVINQRKVRGLSRCGCGGKAFLCCIRALRCYGLVFNRAPLLVCAVSGPRPASPLCGDVAAEPGHPRCRR